MIRLTISATKHLDIETLRVAIFSYLISKKQNKPLMVIIDDTDKQNNIEGIEKEILELLNLFSIEHERVVYQSENLKYHQKIIMQLMAQKKAFSCFCSDEKLKELNGKYDGFCSTLSDETVLNCNAPFTVRIKEPESKIFINDLLKGELDFKASKIDSFIALRHDKSPMSVYASAIDDMLYNISTVITKDDESLNAPRETYTRSLLSYDAKIDYLHLSKISNKNSINDVKWFIDEGFLPSALASYLYELSLKTNKNIDSLEDVIENFDINNINEKVITFDIEKLKEINKRDITLMDDLRLSKILGFADADIGKLGKLYLNKFNTINEIKEKVSLIFESATTTSSLEDEIKECIKKAPYFNDFNDLKTYINNNTKIEEKEIEDLLSQIILKDKNIVDINEVYPLIKNYIGEIIK